MTCVIVHVDMLIFVSGLLVAACVNRAPEGLIGAAVAEVGVLDLLKVSHHAGHESEPSAD